MSKITQSLISFLKPFTKWFGNLHFPFTRKKVKGDFYYTYRDMIDEGVIFLTSTRGEFSNFINPMKIKHGGIYIGRLKGIPTVAEAVGKGFVFTDLVSFLMSKDYVKALRFSYLNSDQKKQIRKEADSIKGWGYDYDFNLSNKKVYCFEAIARIYNSTCEKPCIEPIRQSGHIAYGPDSFLKNDNFYELFDSEKFYNLKE